MKYTLLTVFLVLSFNSSAAMATKSNDYVSDENLKIKRLFVNEEGRVAAEFTTSLPGANGKRVCGEDKAWKKYWAGLSPSANDKLVSALFSAQAQGKKVKIGTRGCIGNWHKIINIYIVE